MPHGFRIAVRIVDLKPGELTRDVLERGLGYVRLQDFDRLFHIGRVQSPIGNEVIYDCRDLASIDMSVDIGYPERQGAHKIEQGGTKDIDGRVDELGNSLDPRTRIA